LLSLYADAPVMTVSESSARSLRDIGLRGPIEVIVNPLMPPQTPPPAPAIGRIGFIGRLTPSKRIDHIIQALAIVRCSVPEAELVIAGAGAQREIQRLRDVAQRAGVADRVHLLGRLSTKERDEVIAGLDVLAMASLREGWGLVVSEAARFYVPAAVYPVAGLIDSVRHGHTGLIADEETPQALAASLESIIRDRELRARIGKSAAEYISLYSEDRFVMHSERALRSIFHHSAARSDRKDAPTSRERISRTS
jgi:glycosyltransferase involved in cell wall biosynthesis